jgi:DNA polymerase-3 subunit chi
VRFLIDGAPLPADAKAYERIVLVFDGSDEDAVADARQRWSAAKGEGFEVTYWHTDEAGRWVKKA